MIVTSAVVVAPIPETTRPPRAPRPRLGLFLTGADGSTWDLRSGPVMMQPGTNALTPAEIEHKWSEPPVLDGGVHRGKRTPMVTRTLPVLVMADPGMPFVDLDGAFARALSGEECLLTAVAPNAQARTISFWFNSFGDVELEDDPIETGIAAYPLSITYPDPFWRGATVSRTFKMATDFPTLFEHVGAIENLVPSGTTGTAEIRNDGDVASWPVYAVTGPVDSFSVGVGDSTLDFGRVAEEQTVWIDTHPTQRTIGFERGGNDESAWLRLTSQKFAAVPPGAEVPIVAALAGAEASSSLMVELTPRYRRPW